MAQSEATATLGYRPAQALALALLYAGIWAVVGRYHGLQHDAQIYVMQALAILQPDVYSGDLYLKFGSQDQFTLFSNFCAPWIDALGVDHGAATLTFGFFVLWTWSAWLLAKHLSDSRDAWLVAGLLLVLPGWYGAGRVFELSELFLSARLPAQALSLLAIVAAIRGTSWLAVILLAVALITHPLMTVPAIITIAVAAIFKQASWRVLLVVGISLGVTCLVAGAVLGGGHLLMSGDWLAAVRSRSNFLFVDEWVADDWQNAGVVLVTLAIAISLPAADWTRRVGAAALCTAIAGLLATTFVSLLLPLRIVIQGQPWRWIWIATFLAIALLPRTIRLLWSASGVGKAATLLLATAWLMNGVVTDGSLVNGLRGPLAGVAALLLMVQWRLPDRVVSLLLRGAWLLVGMCLLWVSSIFATEAGITFDFGGDPAWVQRVGGVLLTPALGALVVVAAWLFLSGSTNNARAFTLAAFGTVLAIGAGPQAWAQWSDDRFGESRQQAFAEWRAMIRPDQEVLWPDGLQPTWFILGRRSYLSLSQLGGIVFSEALSEEARIRAAALSSVFPAGSWFYERESTLRTSESISPAQLDTICRAPGVAFFVSNVPLVRDALSAEWPTKSMYVYLHDCRRFVSGPS